MIARALAWLAGVVALLGGAWLMGNRNARQGGALEAAEAYAKTRKDVDDAANDLGDDPAVLRDWLRERPADKP